MAGSAHRVVSDRSAFGHAYWLPPGGWGNGLDDDGWVALADVASEYVASLLLAVLRDARVPAYAASLRPPLRARRRNGRRPVRIWVGAGAYGRAQTTLLSALPEVVRRYGSEALGG